METKEKGDELIQKYLDVPMAIIAVEEIINCVAPEIDRYENYYQRLKPEMTQVYWNEVLNYLKSKL